MSLFNDFTRGCLTDATSIIGTESFTISGAAGSYVGILNEFESAKEVDAGGIMARYNATLECELDQFSAITGSLERAIDGRRITIGGRVFKAVRVMLDIATLRIELANETNP